MMNPGTLMKLMQAKNEFTNRHPKFVAFFNKIVTDGVQEGDVIDIKITRTDGSEITSNMRVQQSDIELVNELKKLSKQ